MNRALASVLLTFSANFVVLAQCAIRPIKPIPPIGCKDVAPECVSDSNGKSHWNWICVPENAGKGTRNNPAWKPHQTEPAPPSRANANPPQAAPGTSVSAPFQEPAAAEEPAGVPIGEMDTGEQHATEQLRAIAEAIRRCPDYQSAYHSGIATYFYAPINVVWDVERIQSARARMTGYVEYVQHSYDILGPMVECKKRDTECKSRNQALKETYDIVSAMDSRAQYRYEFDIGPHGLEFSRALWKHEKDDASHWAATTLNADGCIGGAVFTIVNRARASLDAYAPVADSPDATIRPPAIPNELWAAAKQGEVNAQFNIGFLYESGNGVSPDFSEAMRWYRKAADQGNADAQFHLGNLYSEGRGVPQDYAAAYFWLDLAASGKLEFTKPEEVAKVRDDTASHLTNTVLLQTQERARKWFEDHPVQTNPQ